jgi:hypothetical protein
LWFQESFRASELWDWFPESYFPDSSRVSDWSVPFQALSRGRGSPSLGLDSRSLGSGLQFQAESFPESA